MEKIPQVKLYRKITIGNTTYVGSKDRNIRELDYILNIFPSDYFRGKKVLDIGCAGGGLVFALSADAKSVVGIDIEESRIEAAKKIQKEQGISNVLFFCANAHQWLDSHSESFDCVFLLNVLHHEKNPKILLSKVFSCDAICIEHPDKAYFSGRKGYDPSKTIHIMTKKQIRKFLAKNGFVLKQRRSSKGPHVRGTRSVMFFEKTKWKFDDKFNYVLIGPSGSGRSYIYDKLPEEKKGGKVRLILDMYNFDNDFFSIPTGRVVYTPGCYFGIHDFQMYVATIKSKKSKHVLTVVCKCDPDVLIDRLKKRTKKYFRRVKDGEVEKRKYYEYLHEKYLSDNWNFANKNFNYDYVIDVLEKENIPFKVINTTGKKQNGGKIRSWLKDILQHL